jgi:PBSX family phage terminase large subunit
MFFHPSADDDDNLFNDTPDNAPFCPYPALWPAQINLLKRPAHSQLDVCCYQGGYGSGKTFAGSLLGLMLSQKYPGSIGLVVAKTWPLLRQTTLQSYFDHLTACHFQFGVDYAWHATEHALTFANGSKILFRHIETPEAVKSLNCAWIEVEEMAQLTEDDFLMLLSRLRQPGIACYRLFGHTNPQPLRGWIYRHFVDRPASPQGSTITYRRIIASTLENKALNPVYTANMQQQYDADYYRVNVLGQDAEDHGGLVCHNWSPDNITNTPYKPDLRLYLTCDFNIDPMCWAVAHRYNDEYHFIDELCVENCSTQQAADVFYERYADHTSGVTIVGDASGNNRGSKAQSALETDYIILRNRLTQRGLPDVRLDTVSRNGPVQVRVATWNAMLCDGKQIRRIKIHPRCRHLIQNCENLAYLPGTSHIKEPTLRQIEANPKLKFVKHIWDAASYLVMRYNPIVLQSHKKPSIRFIPFNPQRDW